MSKLPIPAAALDKHIAFLGATGSGKTSAAKSGVVEPALEAGERVLMIDPTGAWWGLRVGANGKSKGYPIYIFGGDHGDYPLRAKDAAVLAEAFGTSSDSAIFDTSLMTVAERTAFFTEFAEAIRRKNKGPLKLIIDEAHLFMPQAGAAIGGGVPAMLHAGNNLVSLGRSRGLRITLISQRPAKLHKDSLTQVQSMIAMRLMAPQDRKAVSEWIADQADPERGKEIVASLPSLKPGEAWVWAPEAGVLNRVTFPLPKTFDSSRAPDARDGAGPQLAPINLDALKGRLGTVEAETKANDPKALKAEVARLSRELAAKSAAPVADSKAEQTAYDRGLAEGLNRGENRAKAALASINDRLKDAVAVAGAAIESLDSPAPAPLARPRAAVPPVRAAKPPVVARAAPIRTASAPADGMTAPQRRVMTSLAFWRSIGHESPTREQVAAVAGYRPGSGNFNNIIGGLSTMGQTTVPAAGRLSLNVDFNPLTPDEARDKLWSVFENPQRKLVEAAKEASGDLSRDELATNAGYAPGSGNFNNIAGKLSSMDVLQRTGTGRVALSDWAREVLA